MLFVFICYVRNLHIKEFDEYPQTTHNQLRSQNFLIDRYDA